MRGLSCARTGALLGRPRTSLTDADRLRLEHHLGECAACRFDAHAIAGVVSHVESAKVEGVADRALRSALSSPPRTAIAPRTHRTAISAAVVLGIAFSIAVAWGVSSTGGESEHEGKAVHALVAADGSTLSIGDASVHVAAGSVLKWDDAEVVLRRGELDVEVDPRSHRSFRVTTPHFVVEVTGTIFEVSLERVRVRRGSVRIISPVGDVLEPSVSEGQTWWLDPRRATRIAEARAEVAALAPTAERPAHVSERPRRERPQPTPAPEPIAEETPRERYEHAVRIQTRDPAAAESIYRALEAEGGPWAANALFARAELALSLGRSTEARVAFRRYLSLYPDGVNAADARALSTASE